MDISKVTLHPHPAQKHVNGTPVWDGEKPVSMFPNARAIKIDGYTGIIGYVEIEPGKPINFIVPPNVIDESMKESIAAKVREKLGTEGPVSQVPNPTPSGEEED